MVGVVGLGWGGKEIHKPDRALPWTALNWVHCDTAEQSGQATEGEAREDFLQVMHSYTTSHTH